MLERIYIDNFRCMVSFELAPSRLSLLLGKNGSGKSTLFEALRTVRDFVSGSCDVDAAFPAATRTRWQTHPIQCFELDVTAGGYQYRYRLEIEHDTHQDRRQVWREELFCDGRPVCLYEVGEIQLYRDNHVKGPRFAAERSRSALTWISPVHEDERLTWFKQWFASLWIVAPEPRLMSGETRGAHRRPDYRMADIASWYRQVAVEDPQATRKLEAILASVIDGFIGLKLPRVGRDTRMLTVSMRAAPGNSSPERIVDCDLDELSDGQRALIALYALIYLGLDSGAAIGRTLCIDEPGNCLGVGKIQPWLMRLCDRLGQSAAQVLLISHHPEVIDYLAAGNGKLIERINTGPARARDFVLDQTSGLAAAEMLARGW